MTDQFIQVFKALTLTHEAFNENALKKQECIKTGDLPKLEEVVREESALIQQLGKLESTRQHLVQQIIEDKGLVKEDITTEKILPFFSEQERLELKKWQQRLVTQITQLKDQNELNKQLLKESLRFVNMSLDTMKPQQEFNNYRRPGSVGNKDEDDFEPGGRSLFDSKA